MRRDAWTIQAAKRVYLVLEALMIRKNSATRNLSFGASALALLAIMLLAVKLILVSQREMAVESNDPTTYVRMSLYHLSLFDFHGHPPGASYVMWFARTLGIPYRVFEEIILALAIFLFLRPLVACRMGLVIAIPALFLMMFNPNLVLAMDIASAEPPYLFVLLAGLGGVLGVIFARRDRLPMFSFALIVAAFGFLALIRDDGPIVWVAMAATAVFSLIFLRSSEGWRFKRAVVACGCAVAANLIAGQAMSAAAYSSNGYWGSSPVQSREWWGLYSALLAIPVPRSKRHALINEQNLDLAASLSPTFAKYRSCLDQVRRKSDNFEIRNEHIQWRLGDCIKWKTNEFMRMREEITQGAQAQGIELRWPVLGIIPLPVSQWIPSLIPSALHVIHEAKSNPNNLVLKLNGLESWVKSPQKVQNEFDKALLRRSYLAQNSENTELAAYNYFLSPMYAIVSQAGLIATGVILLVALGLLFTGRMAVGDQLIFFAMALVSFDIAARIGYYTIVDWIGWGISGRYVLPSQVLLGFTFTSMIVIVLARLWPKISQRLFARAFIE